MKWHKRLLKHPFVLAAMAWLVFLMIKFLYFSNRWTVRGRQHVDKMAADGQPFIFAFWHGRLLLTPCFAPKNMPLDVVISSHGDGKFISKAVTFFGIKTIEGSSRRGGMGALKASMSSLQDGRLVTITPDGPRGPRMRIGGNVVEIASRCNVPIIPLSYATTRHTLIKSWDRFFLPKPFGRGIFIFGEPLYIAPDADVDTRKKAGKELENRLNMLTNTADTFVGITPVKPE